jgi:tetratricopeptide (TPR) repeat protein
MMKRNTQLMLVFLAILALATTSCAKLQARDNLNKGVQAFTEAHYENAINYFKEAVRLDPELTNAEIYLATAYAQMFIPGAGSEENQKYAEMAEKTFQQVLARDANNINAVAGLASIYQNTTQFDKSHEYYLKYAQMDPTNPIPFYAVGTVDWIVVSNLQNPRPEEEQASLIEEGLSYLDKALALNPDYEEAMAYKNLLYRQKARLAGLVAEKKAAATKDRKEKDSIMAAADEEKKNFTAQADDWFNKAMETRKKLQEQKKGTAVGAEAP